METHLKQLLEKYIDPFDSDPNRLSALDQELARYYQQQTTNHTDTSNLIGDYNTWRDRLIHACQRIQISSEKLGVLSITLQKTNQDTTSNADIIKHITDKLLSCLKKTDSVYYDKGLSFLVIGESVHSHQDITELCEKIIATFQNFRHSANETIDVQTHIGVSVFPNDDQKVDALITKSAQARQKAITSDNDNFYFFSSALERFSSYQISIEKDIRQAFVNGDFSLKYQPIYHHNDKSIVGVEAFLRCDVLGKAVQSPLQFLDFIEQSGLIIPIGEWSFETALAQLREWHDIGFPALRMSINVSSVQFFDSQFKSHVADLLSIHNLSGQCLELDIKESLFHSQLERVKETLLPLKELGIKVAWDDFGVGDCPIGCLLKLPIDKIKIDKSLIRKTTHNQRDAAYVHAIINLAHSLSIATIAEGVENKEEFELLIKNQCDFYQGHHLAEAVSSANMTEILLESTSQNLLVMD